MKVGIIGVGNIALYGHLPGYKKLEKIVNVVSMCDNNKDFDRKQIENYNTRFYENYTEMLKKEKLDVVSVCVPNKYHCKVTVDALKAGCHVLCEKPPAMSLKEVEMMANTAKEQKRILLFGFQFRMHPEVKLLKNYIDNGKLGFIYHCKIQALRRRGIPGWGNYTSKDIQGGGAFIDYGVHFLDIALYLLGYKNIDFILANTQNYIGKQPGTGFYGDWNHKEFDVEDYANGYIQFKDGTSLYLETSFAANIEEKENTKIHFLGSKAGTQLFPFKMFKEEMSHQVNVIPIIDKQNNREKLVEHFVQCCLGNEKPIFSMEEALFLQNIIDKFYESSRLSDRIKL
ncbi:MAG: Gfo/Idh/MocA family oxidoreductase [Firmicutes bacterium]|nr:Gfo/Idh/MocA family oxidoreductase [Bacillota bacterium]